MHAKTSPFVNPQPLARTEGGLLASKGGDYATRWELDNLRFPVF